MAVHPSARFAYVANSTSDDVTTFAIDSTTGALTEVGTEVLAGTTPRSVTVDPSGRFAYVVNEFSDDVTTFAIDPTTGALTAVGTGHSRRSVRRRWRSSVEPSRPFRRARKSQAPRRRERTQFARAGGVRTGSTPPGLDTAGWWSLL